MALLVLDMLKVVIILEVVARRPLTPQFALRSVGAAASAARRGARRAEHLPPPRTRSRLP